MPTPPGLTFLDGLIMGATGPMGPTGATGAAGTVADAVTVIETLIALRAYSGTEDQVIYLRCRATDDDGGGGTFVYNAGASPGTYFENGGTVYLPTGGDGSAAWVRQYVGAIYPEWFGATGDGATDDTAALQLALDYAGSLSGGTTVQLSEATYKITDTLTVEKYVSIRGLGKRASVFTYNGTGAGIKRALTINQSNRADAIWSDFGITCTNGSNADGGIVDVGGSFWWFERIRVYAFKYGAILDQSEVATISSCEFENCPTAGVWLVNGDEYTTGASAEFTNRITVADCQFNGGDWGILDDGGYTHHFFDNNLNGHFEASLRIAGTFGCLVESSEFEGMPTGILLSAYDVDSELKGIPSLTLGGGNIISPGPSFAPDRKSFQVDACTTLTITGDSFLYGDIAISGSENIAVLNCQGTRTFGHPQTFMSGLPDASGVVQVGMATGVLVNNSFQRAPVTDCGSVKLWVFGDDEAINRDRAASPDTFTSVSNRGWLASVFQESGFAPDIGTLNSLSSFQFGNTDMFTTTAAVADMVFLADGNTEGSEIFIGGVRITSWNSSASVILQTYGGTGTGITIYATSDGILHVIQAHGTGLEQDFASAAATIALNTTYTIRVSTSGTTKTVYVNGTQIATGTITNPTSTPPNNTLQIGRSQSGFNALGYISEVLIFDQVLTAGRAARVTEYLERWI